MPRTLRVLEMVQESTALSLADPRHCPPGIHAEQIAESLGLDRANVSKLLNNLQKAGKLIKIQGRPTLYADRENLTRRLPGTFIPAVLPDGDSFCRLFEKTGPVSAAAPIQTALERQIGWDGSLKTAILQAKAAVSYPPRGLHTLLVGNQGVGKSLFAQQMFDYAQAAGKLSASAEFVMFNCQDYAASPQFLISRLFGCAKGAIQGNEKARKGAVEAAAGGILCINDIHKLPPKAMELFITLLEKNVFSRLGDASVIRQADVMVIAATTEPEDSPAVLRLAQSIPVLIRLPDMRHRGARELLEHLFLFFSREADSIRLPIRVHRDVLACLAGQQYPGNIGEMKSMVRIVCSHAYLACSAAVPPHSSMDVTCAHLPASVLDAVRGDTPRSPELAAVLDALDGEAVVFTPGKETTVPLSPAKAEQIPAPESSASNEPVCSGVQQMGDYIQQCVARLKSGADAGVYAPEKLVSAPIYAAVRQTLENCPPYRCVVDTPSLQYGFLLHLRGALSRAAHGTSIAAPSSSNPQRTNPREYALAEALRENLAHASGIILPEEELVFLSMYLYLASKWSEESRVGLLAVFHGSHAAEALAESINTRCGCNRVGWVNFSPGMNLETLTAQVLEQASRLDMGLGVLLLTDMEPLTSLHRVVAERTGIQAETLVGLSPSAMLSVAQKSMESGFTLGTLWNLSSPESSTHWKREDFPESALMDRIIHEILADSLTFLDPAKAARTLLAALNGILKDLCVSYSDAVAVKFIFHCSHMLERVVRNDSFKYPGLNAFVREHGDLISRIEQQLASTEEIFGVFIPPSELAYIAEIFLPLLPGKNSGAASDQTSAPPAPAVGKRI